MINQFDKTIELQLDIFRASNSIKRDVLRLLADMEKELIARASNASLTTWGRARVGRQLKEVRELTDIYYNEIADVSSKSTKAITGAAVNSTVVSMGLTGEAIITPTQKMLESIASRSLVQGATQGEWWSRQSADTAFRFSRSVRQGIVAGDSNQKIVRAVRDFVGVSKANAAALVQTSVATAANDARNAVFAANEDIIKAYRAVATLDTHTCLQCAPLDGKEWTIEGKPRGHKFPMPVYPLHYNCRCLLIARVTSGEPEGERATADGPIDASLTFDSWLERQSKNKQAEVLGKGRAKMYQDGKITLSDLVTGNGSQLTIDELESKYK